MRCTECQKEIPAGSVFCPVCGSAQFEETVDFAVQTEPVEESVEVREEPVAETSGKPRIKVKKKWWILAAACLLLAVAAAVVLANRPSGYAVYATADSLLLTDLSRGEPIRLAGNISLGQMLLTKDEKHLFYQEGDDISTGYLYYLDLRSDPMEPVKLAKNATYLFINDRGTRLGYIREGNLYVHNLESETRIAYNVAEFLCDEDVDTFAFARLTAVIDSGVSFYERVWYFQDGDQEPILVGDGRKGVQVLGLSTDGKTMIYTGDGGIYAWKNGKETVIAEHAGLAGSVFEDLTFYYYAVNKSGQDVVCFYDGKQSIEITDAQNARISAMTQPMLRWQDDESGHCFVALRDRVLEIPLEDVLRAEPSEDGKTLYVTTQKVENRRCLYTVDISRNQVGQPQLLVENVPYFNLEPLGDRLYYWVGETGKPGDLYCDGELILENVKNNLQVHEETGALLARGEASSDYRAAIYMVRNGRVIKLTDEGGQIGFATNGDALVMTGKAELWCFNRSGTGTLLASNAQKVYSLWKRS